MAKVKHTEAQRMLKLLTKEQLMALHKLRGDSQIFDGLKSLFNNFVYGEEGRIVSLVSDVGSADDAVKINSKQNFHRGRVSAVVLVHALMVNAEKEMERREKNG